MTLLTILDAEWINIFLNPQAWVALLTLTFLEIILGIDNIVFISIISGKLKSEDQPRARNIGLGLAMVFRVILLFGIKWVLSLQESLFHLKVWGFSVAPSGQSIIILIGGLFLLYKAVNEIHHKLEGDEEETAKSSKGNLTHAIFQIAMLNLVFSFDSILTAIGLVSLEPSPLGFGETGGLVIMVLAIIISIIIMMVFAGPVSKFVNEHPTIQILGLSFLILIGVMLLAEGSHLAHLAFGKMQVHAIPKGYLYFAIFFSLAVEFINIKMRKNRSPIELNYSEIEDDKLK
ncbi:MAG: TerC family protein [Flavobacteriales bacterium]